jgi:hypothetical protein
VEGFGAAAILAALLTWLDIDRVFYVPATVPKRAQLYGWIAAFVVGNSILAVALYGLLKDGDPFKSWPPLAAGAVIGLSYLALVRIKFATFTFGDKDIPFGLELFYDAAKAAVYRRVNGIAKEARRQETIAYADARTIDQLREEAVLSVDQDALLPPEEKTATRKWIEDTVADVKASERDRKLTLANYIKSGRRP